MPLTLLDLARDKKLSVDFLKEQGLFETQSGVKIPYFDLSGKEIRRRIRSALKAGEGTIWDKGKGALAYGVWRLSEAITQGFIIIVEGESDCWTLWHTGFPALGVPGASNYKTLKPDYFSEVDTVYVVQESDKAGKKFVLNVTKHLRDGGYRVKIKVVPMNEYKDPNELFRALGSEFIQAFQKRLDEGKPAPSAEESLVVCMADVKAEDVRFLWFPYLPLGKLTVIDGDPGIGKSWLTLALCAAVTVGAKFPDGERVISGRVLLLAMEDGLADTVRKRLDGMDAELDQFFAITKPMSMDASTQKLLKGILQKYAPRLFIIDPLTAFIGEIKRLAKLEGISEKTLRRVAKSLKIEYINKGNPGQKGRQKTLWQLPAALMNDLSGQNGHGREFGHLNFKDSDRPKICCCCKSTDFWRKPSGGWVCGNCHPNPNKPKTTNNEA